jgi:[ribosomal protein S5]-alanine N-acetyltransferase
MLRLFPIDTAGLNATETPRDRTEALVALVDATLSLYQRRGAIEPWIGYVAVENGEWVGGCGFAGPPQGGEAEIAYTSFAGHEGRGVATRMAQELLRLARPAAQAAGVRFIAHTLPEEGASTRILRKLGFQGPQAIVHPDDGPVWKWVEPDRPTA